MKSNILFHLILIGALSVMGCKNTPPSTSTSSADPALSELKKRNLSLDPEVFIKTAAAGDDELTGLFLKAGMNPNVTNQYGYTALMWAAGQGRDAVVQMLLDNGADVRARAADGSLPLMFATRQRNVNTAKILLVHGADINAQSGGSTPLILATLENQTEMMDFLLSNGAQPEGRDKEGYTALFYAAHNVKNEDANGVTLPAVKLLLQHGAKVNIQGNDGTTPLAWAARKGEWDICQILLDAGADIKAADHNKKTILIHAVEGEGDPTVAKLFISKGSDVNAQDATGETALIKSCRRKRAATAVVFIQAGADLNLQDNQGETALMVAAAYGNAVIADELLKAGADFSIKNHKGQTALDIAQEQHTAALERLKLASQ
jgi:ankyrin repeat protein